MLIESMEEAAGKPITCPRKTEIPNWDDKTIFEQTVYDAFAPHSSNGFKPMATLRSWDVCDELHEDEMELDCASIKPYSSLHLSDSKIVHVKVRAHLQGRSVSAYSSPKSFSKAARPNTSSMMVRRSKSSRCIATAKSSSSILSPQRVIRGGSGMVSSGRLGFCAMSDPTIKQTTKVLLPFSGVQDIPYDFRPFLRHQQHMESYRKSYTYILMRRFRELRINGYAGYKLQAALRLNISSPLVTKLKTEASKPAKTSQPQRVVDDKSTIPVPGKFSRPCRKMLTPPPVLYFSETCHSGPVLYNRSKIEKCISKSGGNNLVIPAGNSTVLCSYEKVQKSSSELAAANPAKDKFLGGEGVQKIKKQEKEMKKPSQPFKPFRLSSHSNICSVPIIGPLVVGESKTTKSSPKSIRKMSPLGRVPTSSKRSCALMREKKSSNVHSMDGSQCLSIAIESQTVTSPYRQKGSEIDNKVTMT